jgi:hypothetical protein
VINKADERHKVEVTIGDTDEDGNYIDGVKVEVDDEL